LTFVMVSVAIKSRVSKQFLFVVTFMTARRP